MITQNFLTIRTYIKCCYFKIIKRCFMGLCCITHFHTNITNHIHFKKKFFYKNCVFNSYFILLAHTKNMSSNPFLGILSNYKYL